MEGNGNPTRKDAGMPSTVVQLVVSFDQATGAVNVTGPIQNALLCYGMLEAAKDIIRQYVKDNQSPILRPGAVQIAS